MSTNTAVENRRNVWIDHCKTIALVRIAAKYNSRQIKTQHKDSYDSNAMRRRRMKKRQKSKVSTIIEGIQSMNCWTSSISE